MCFHAWCYTPDRLRFSRHSAPQYRDEEAAYSGPANLMFDRRVVRGNTYAARIVPAEPALNASKPRTMCVPAHIWLKL